MSVVVTKLPPRILLSACIPQCRPSCLWKNGTCWAVAEDTGGMPLPRPPPRASAWMPGSAVGVSCWAVAEDTGGMPLPRPPPGADAGVVIGGPRAGHG
eukprot:CAMPEP_0181402024 /NCGR_PEP_ID=MMETSP1110-20121109/2961_1 /TAXON_ID=174948 /ORGANISM="Symbiodinium sp., Strain CCMP421" /LENGTH=97 /DNA_ID=CAMNT_0023524229 /DNA_START=374 /DNA_END=667 /DNA_ORIENTATION=+